jgi:hypothetical protein
MARTLKTLSKIGDLSLFGLLNPMSSNIMFFVLGMPNRVFLQWWECIERKIGRGLRSAILWSWPIHAQFLWTGPAWSGWSIPSTVAHASPYILRGWHGVQSEWILTLGFGLLCLCATGPFLSCRRGPTASQPLLDVDIAVCCLTRCCPLWRGLPRASLLQASLVHKDPHAALRSWWEDQESSHPRAWGSPLSWCITPKARPRRGKGVTDSATRLRTGWQL